MQINLNTLPKCVINLPTRTDRLDKFKKELSLLFDDTDLNVVPGVIDSSPLKGIATAHLNCIRLAKENGWDNVLIMEDDVRFQSPAKVRQYAAEAFNDVPEDFDILLGGIYWGDPVKTSNVMWDSVGEFCALHFYVVNERCYDRLLQFDYLHEIDRWINRTGQFNCYVANKFFAIQYDGWSDNAKKQTDYLPYLSKYRLL